MAGQASRPPEPMAAAACYARNQWSASNVIPFPAGRNRARLEQLAARIAAGRYTIDGTVEALGRHLYLSHVPRDLAEREMVALERELTALTAGEVQHGYPC